MILYSGLILELFQSSKFSKYILGSPLSAWDKRKETLKFNKSPYKVSRILCGVLALAQLIDILAKSIFPTHETSKGDPGIRLGIMFESLFIMIFIYSQETVQKGDLLNSFINQLVSFEKRYYKNQKDNEINRKLTKARLTCWAMRNVALSIPIAVSILAVLLPQLPLNIYSYHPGKYFIHFLETVLNSIVPSMFSAVLIQIAIFTTNMHVWNVAYGVGTVMAIKLVTGAVGISTCVHLFWRKVGLFKYSNNYQRQLLLAVKMYREIQILNECFDQYVSGLLSALLWVVFQGEFNTGLGLLGANELKYIGNKNVKFIAEIIMQSAYVQGFFMAFVVGNYIVGSFGEVYNISKNCLAKISRIVELQRRPLSRKYCKSFAPMKVSIGMSNFVDKTTPIVFQRFIIDRIVDSLLVS